MTLQKEDMSKSVVTLLSELKDWVQGMSSGLKFALIIILALLYSGLVEPYVQSWTGRQELDAELLRDIRRQNAMLQLELNRKEHDDSVRSATHAIYIDLAIGNGFKVYGHLLQLQEETGSNRATVMAATGMADTLSLTPSYGTFLAELQDEHLTPLVPDWEDTFIPPGLKAFLQKTMKADDVVIALDVSEDLNLSRPITKDYLKTKNVKSLLACFIGVSPINQRSYFLLSFYHDEYMNENAVNTDIFYMRNACLGIRKLFGLKTIKAG